MAQKAARKHAQGEYTIVMLRKDYTKSGKSAKRFGLYREGMTVNAYLDACIKLGDDKGAADIRWDSSPNRRGGALIRLVTPKAQVAGKAA